MGDFNAVLNHALDHLGGGGRSYPSFTDWAQVYCLTVDQRSGSGSIRMYVNIHLHTISRIDMAFTTDDTLPIVSTVSYLPRGVSDHAPFSVDLLPNSSPGLNPQWLEDEVAHARKVL